MSPDQVRKMVERKTHDMTDAEILEHVENLRVAIVATVKLFGSLMEDAEALADEVEAWRAFADDPCEDTEEAANSERDMNDFAGVFERIRSMKEVRP
jgi:hypothetical protein